MVYYCLVERNDKEIIYEYYPENRKDKKPGIIRIDIIAEKIRIIKPAQDDFERYAEEFDERWWWYGNHAERCICDNYNNGIIEESGIVAWY